MTTKNRENSYCVTPTIILLVAFTVLSQLSERHFVIASSQDNYYVGRWAVDFGSELFKLANTMTKATEIREQYEANNARVNLKKGKDEDLMKNITRGLERMLKLKINAVRCIVKAAEESHRNFTTIFKETFDNKTYVDAEDELIQKKEYFNGFKYYSSKYSNITNQNITAVLPKGASNTYIKNMDFEDDTHFYNVYVNISHSSVHVPVNIFDESIPVLAVLNWSEALDKKFVANYKADPALSWQYFGSELGILRHFPAKLWATRDVQSTVDVYDCRKRSWYIETATCSKDVVILLDNTGSMHGFYNYLAQLTIKSILDTFSNNDFVNIYLFSNGTRPMVECFDGSLVQATPENIEVFNQAAKYMKQQGYTNEANVTNALQLAFGLLKKYRDIRECADSALGCNQAIMFITDGVVSSFTETLKVLNKDDAKNETHKPVRIFSYLLGNEKFDATEIREMACRNRGNFSHIQTLDQVQGEVLKYVSNIAAPLVLQAEDHPPTWTHAFKDVSYKDEVETQKPRLMIAVGVPVFNKVEREDGLPNPDLLGVASTDVPIDNIEKMALPYKLGVNGYAFIVSNNGYVLLHPDLRPNVTATPRAHNYNSVDLTEVEQFYDDHAPRMPSELIRKLREEMVNHTKGQMLNVSVKLHYDNRKRVAIQNYDYYYAPLPETPFSLGFAIPSGYGSTFIRVGDEVTKTLNRGVKLSDYFVGQNWKLHPEWVYCKYQYLEGHEFDSVEIELAHFLEKLESPSWEWSEQYDSELDIVLNNTEPVCGGRKLFNEDEYYCNKELVQLLIFDAKVTNKSYGQWKFNNKEEKDIVYLYNATLRYVATMSGLTRWQFIFGEDEVEDDKEFGDFHNTAVDETWYKAAVLQHEIERQSFAYHIPHDAIPDSEDGVLRVSASYAIFPQDNNAEAPGCVVGFQFNHDLMTRRFKEIASKKKTCPDCIDCGDLKTDCYVIDNNGYIVISINQFNRSDDDISEVGKFFGEVQGDVMQAMVDMEVFQMVTVYDYQAFCQEYNVTKLSNEDYRFKNPDTSNKSAENQKDKCIRENSCDIQKCWDSTIPINETEEIMKQEKHKAREVESSRACDKKSNLYILTQNISKLNEIQQPDSLVDCHSTSVHHPFFFKLIPMSNLLLIVINKTCGNKVSRTLSASPEEILYTKNFPCYKLNLNNLIRRPLEGCYTEHKYEGSPSYQQTCKGIKPDLDLVILFISAISLIPAVRSTLEFF